MVNDWRIWLEANPLRVTPETPLKEILARMQAAQCPENAPLALVGEQDRPLGLFSLETLLYGVLKGEEWLNLTVGEVMESLPPPVRVCGDCLVAPALDDSPYFPVVDEQDRFVGVIRQGNLRLYQTLEPMGREQAAEVEGEQFFGKMSQSLQEAFDLPRLLQKTVQEIQRLLGVDRVLVYQIQPQYIPLAPALGTKIAEAVGENLPPLTGVHFPSDNFPSSCSYCYQQGIIHSPGDTQQEEMPLCLHQFIEQSQSRGTLVVPILQRESLWGLLIVQQGRETRDWKRLEIRLLQRIAGQLAIATYQSELQDTLQQELYQRQQTQQALSISQQRLEYLLISSPGVLYTCNIQEGRATFISQNAEKLIGYSLAEMMQPGFWLQHLHPDDQALIEQSGLLNLLAQEHYHLEYRFLHQDGSYRWIYDQIKVIYDETGNPIEIIGYWLDISDRKVTEFKLRKSLQEKEILLKEIHHRVKNNLLVVSHLLEFQAEYLQSPELVKTLEDSQNRIYSMALIHEKLYHSTGLDLIDFGEYLTALLENLIETYQVSEQQIGFSLSIEPVFLNIETAQPCALIVNELLSNALKHAFPDGRKGQVYLELKQDAEQWIQIKVQDNGIGFPPSLDFRQVESLGMELVCTLTEQIEGKIKLDRTQGTCFELRFKELNYPQRV
ncbi:histidine kinase dimerization/phosphoacceptor domain -containing protein [Spirulina subsalsa]|uniref:histidine kinase dimerization/phosphoacceptor domain -containing protein n=1 Tax=Spirulina subsalsa TaxID=54311 RepID=UPI0002DE4933|nr:histidine kinase dimerization/phosphoacceptor domain -containing protein [Spirulina subsalsa]